MAPLSSWFPEIYEAGRNPRTIDQEPYQPPTDYYYSQFLCKQLVPFNKCLISSSLCTHTHNHTHTHKGWPGGEEIELAGCNAAPCVCNQNRLRIQSHCKSVWSESQRPLGEAVLITRYDYSRGNVCVCVWVVVRFVWESWLTDFLGNVRLHAHDYAQVSMTVISNGDKCKTEMHI